MTKTAIIISSLGLWPPGSGSKDSIDRVTAGFYVVIGLSSYALRLILCSKSTRDPRTRPLAGSVSQIFFFFISPEVDTATSGGQCGLINRRELSDDR